MDPRWGLKRRQNEHDIVDNPDHATPRNNHKSLKSNIISRYKGDTWNEICLLEILRIKIERRTADLQLYFGRKILLSSNYHSYSIQSSPDDGPPLGFETSTE